ncbi:hypothetical protein [Microcystis phage Mae-JY29]
MSGGDGLEALEPFLGELIAAAAPGQRRKLIDKLMRAVRRANAARIGANVDPDGGAMVPRKPREAEGRGRRKKMFRNIGKTRSLKVKVSADQGELAFGKGSVEATAAVHHYGLEGFVGKTKGGRVIRTKYEARRLLGFGKERDELVDEVLKHFGG